MASAIYRFGEFQLDPASRELRRGEEDLALPLKVFDCVVYLVENRDRAVGRDELIEAVWGDAHLSDSVLGQAILLARKALDDTGEEQHVIKTVRGFGYRWAAPVDVARSQDTVGTGRRPRRRSLWLLLGILATIVLAAGWPYLRRDREPEAVKAASATPATGEIAILLPVRVEAGEGHAWIRLGLMDLIAERLRAAGQAMVPSDTVIALLGDGADALGQDDVDRLAETTAARLVLAARAEVEGTRWTVSLHSLLGPRPPVTAAGEAHDVLEAARICADRMARALGLTPPADRNADPGLQMLLQRIRAARLAQQMDVARALIEDAEPRLRRHPEIRFQRATIEIYSHRLDAAEAVLVPLLEETPAEVDPVLRARTMSSLAVVNARREDWRVAESTWKEAAALLSGLEPLTALEPLRTLGMVHTNLAGAVLARGDVEAAREQIAQARRIFRSLGDVQALGVLDISLGVLEARRERYTEALHYFKSAADRHTAVHDAGSELHARAYLMAAHLELLNPQTASAVEPRVLELVAQVDNPWLAAIAELARVDLLDASGRSQAAAELLRDVILRTEAHEDLLVLRAEALVRAAERAVYEGDAEQAAEMAGEVIDRLGLDHHREHDTILGQAGLALVRAHLSRGNRVAAMRAAARIDELAEDSGVPSPRIDATLARAAIAAAKGKADEARAAFELALSHADATQAPRRLLEVAQSYVPWLLGESARGLPDLERALSVADRLTPYADRHYEAALLQLRVYQASGPPSAWRTALSRARSLAGERPIPPELLKVPRSDQEVIHE